MRHKNISLCCCFPLLPLLRIARVAANSCSKRTFGSRITIGVAFNLKKWDRTFLRGLFPTFILFRDHMLTILQVVTINTDTGLFWVL